MPETRAYKLNELKQPAATEGVFLYYFYDNRLQEIEKEIEQEREAQGNVEEHPKVNSKWTWGK